MSGGPPFSSTVRVTAALRIPTRVNQCNRSMPREQRRPMASRGRRGGAAWTSARPSSPMAWPSCTMQRSQHQQGSHSARTRFHSVLCTCLFDRNRFVMRAYVYPALLQVVPFFSAVFMSLTSTFFVNFLSVTLPAGPPQPTRNIYYTSSLQPAAMQ